MQKSLITLALASKMPTWASHSHLSTLMEQEPKPREQQHLIELRTLGQFQFSCEHPLPISWQIKILDSSYTTNNFPKWKITRKPLRKKMFHLKHLFKKKFQKYFNWNKIHLPSFVFVSVEIYFQKCVYRVSKQVLDWFWAKKLNFEKVLRFKLRWKSRRPLNNMSKN